MNLNTGSILFSALVDTLMENVASKELRKKIYEPVYHEFRDCGWKGVDQLKGIDPVLDEIIKEDFRV